MQTIVLRTAQTCADCGAELAAGQTVRRYGANFYCLNEHQGIKVPPDQERPRPADAAPTLDDWTAIRRDAVILLDRVIALLRVR